MAVVVAVIVGATLALMAIVGDLVADKCAASRAHRAANQCTLAASGECTEACAACTANKGTFAGANAAVVISRIVMEVRLRHGGQGWCKSCSRKCGGDKGSADVHMFSRRQSQCYQ